MRKKGHGIHGSATVEGDLVTFFREEGCPPLFMQYDPGHFPSLFQGAAALLGMMLGVFAYRENGLCLESFLGQAKDTFSPLPYSLL